jgi:hypothetical protein
MMPVPADGVFAWPHQPALDHGRSELVNSADGLAIMDLPPAKPREDSV